MYNTMQLTDYAQADTREYEALYTLVLSSLSLTTWRTKHLDQAGN